MPGRSDDDAGFDFLLFIMYYKKERILGKNSHIFASRGEGNRAQQCGA